ncbi:hypothetical protein HK104_003323 [Borealophlyctis nickersoniae]|nr:hypothetical protein HK104_003323 [Borealophlyctis nickersoniae]
MPVLLALSLATLLAAGSSAAPVTPAPSTPSSYPFFPVKGTGQWAAPVAKAKALVKQLTVEEKATIVTGVGWTVTPCVGNIGPVPKIGFKGLCLQDGPAGVRFADKVSNFGASINVAATFDKTLMETRGRLMGAEFRGKGANVALAPMMNMGRVPEGGRNWEGQGADPYLAAVSASLQVKGIESTGVIATAKHFIGNEQEHGRSTGSSNIDDRTMHEIYLPPFVASVNAGAGAIMCSYNKVNGTYACENPALLQTILKGELDFNGFVMTDWWAAKSGAPTALGGSDMMMPHGVTLPDDATNEFWGPHLVEMVKNGTVPAARLDDMATRVLAAWVKSGQDKGGFPEVNFDSWNKTKGRHVDVQGDHKKHIREVGAASAILLKNEGGVLPLKKGVKTLGLVGSDAMTPADPNQFPDRGGVNGTVALGWGSGTSEFPYLVGPDQGILSQAKPLGIKLLNSFDDANLTAAADIAKKSDVAIVFVFSDSGEEYITVQGNMGDRNNLNVWNNGDALVKTVADLNKNTIVVIHSPGPINMPWATHPNVKSIIMALLPGQESGNALADVLFGRVNPSGRLPFTINKKPADYSAHVEYNKTDEITYTEGLLVDYRYNQAKGVAPLYAFGHGLSYTSFKYSTPTTTSVSSYAPRTATVSVSVTNTGRTPGHEVVQLYIRAPTEAGKPFSELKGFERVYLKAGETRVVKFKVTERDLSYWSTQRGDWVMPRGVFKVEVGASSADVRGRGELRV